MISHQTLCDLPASQPSSQHQQQSIYQPCLPPFDPGATKILPFLFLGSQTDAFNKDLLKSHNITYELNVSTTCPKPDHVQESNFLRIPVNDSYNERLIPYFPIAFDFLEKVRQSEGCALVHCFAGISRSTTIVIAYLMQHSRLTFDDAYRYVKSKRATISPNFHFLGQLLEYEEMLKKEWMSEPTKVDTILLSPLPIKEDISIEQKRSCSPSTMPLSSSCSALSSLTSPAPSGPQLNGKGRNLTLKMPTKSQRNVDRA
ncbi:dual specificity protein phosphatase 16-like isoform X2 [Brevipalpus obovatus]|uniref:dual specificity protein phosphatase 16-like isoform X2 n=1 Tax=Brevipalpus obovatus TaxID=246614 RepID=UPI003D9ED28C